METATFCTCSKCGKAYDRAAWEALPGTDGGGKEWVFSDWDMLELRNCPCGGTMGVCPIPAVLQVAS